MKDTIGTDISKDTLDAHRLGTSQAASFANSPTGLRALHRWIGAQRPDLVVYEGQTTGLAALTTPPLNANSPGSCWPRTDDTTIRSVAWKGLHPGRAQVPA
jgi:hypothetical protein